MASMMTRDSSEYKPITTGDQFNSYVTRCLSVVGPFVRSLPLSFFLSVSLAQVWAMALTLECLYHHCKLVFPKVPQHVLVLRIKEGRGTGEEELRSGFASVLLFISGAYLNCVLGYSKWWSLHRSRPNL